MNNVKKTRLNEDIRAPQIRLIDSEGTQVGVVSREDGLSRAAEVALDLVEIVPHAEPPVCKIMDYGKFLFQEGKKHAHQKVKRVQVKKLRIRPGIEEGDYQVKLRNLMRFLKEGNKVEISLRFRGREMSHKELGLDVLNRLKVDLSEYSDVEREPKLDGRQIMMVLVPKKNQ